MGGKGKRRREKNYRAAHGGYSGLPPPPNPSQLDALPSKLRQIMSFSQDPNGANGSSKNQNNNDGHAQNKWQKETWVAVLNSGCGFIAIVDVGTCGFKDSVTLELKTTSKDKSDVRTKDVIEGNTNERLKELQHMDKSEEQLVENGAIDKKKKKRKRKEVKDLRFEMEVDKASSQLKRRERKKK
ncbi:hypothetical protein V8G54_018178 [Vigna mungo]|uniref:Uncharacterized protein n=1 Tax=Vigna mungo TaxID=3915 RepID=A0AAQ3RSG6_VIGMU